MSRPPTANQGTKERLKDVGREAKKWLKHPIDSFRSRAPSPVRAAWSFTQLLLKKAPIAVDTNPVKIVFGIAQIALELKKGMQDNMDTTERRIAALLDLIIVVVGDIQNRHGKSPDENRAMEAFEAALTKELDQFFAIQEQSKAHQFLVQEEDKQNIADIFERVNEARQNMILATGLRVHKVVVTIDQKLNKLLRDQLKPSYIADHKYYLEGEMAKAVRRVACTPGTRPSILIGVKTWANDPSNPHSIYWLFGPAGTGKSTIACTIARRFEFACDPNDSIVLGANFFCSRQFPDTRSVAYVIRTIVYQLTLACKAFADAYHEHGDDSTINQGPIAQLEGLLVKPWEASQAGRTANNDPVYLVDIDAVDELDGDGGSKLIAALLNVQGQLQGLKFFITSREDQALVAHAQCLGDGNVCRLQEISPKEADEDVKTYLVEQLGHVASEEEIQQLVTDAAGLFIYAATVVEQLKGRPFEEQRMILGELLNAPNSPADSDSSQSPTQMLDNLYFQILEQALNTHDCYEALYQHRLRVLHTFLCTVERTSPSVAAQLLSSVGNANATKSAEAGSVAHYVLRGLHAVLYMEGDRVMWFHKSFPDFVFDHARSKRFYCDQASHHRLLVEGCFRTMLQQLRFNIADILDSSILDRDSPTLDDLVKHNISPALGYTCRSWSQHLIAAMFVDPATILQSLHDFIQLRVLFWIETMNLLGQRGRCDGMLREARTWIVSSKGSANLAKRIGDAAAFAVYFSASPAAASTPHLYLSALATFPHQTDLRTTWRDHFGGIPAFTNAIQGTGGSPLMSIMVKSPVNAVAVSLDGACVATGSGDRFVQVWDLSTGEELKTLKGHSDWVRAVAFSPDGTHIASGSDDRTLRVWNASSGEALKILEGHNGYVFSVAFSPDGTRIVSGSEDTTVRVWDASSGEQLKNLKGHSDWVRSVAFSPDGTHIASGSHDGTVRVWNTSSGEELKIIKGQIAYIASLAFSPDGTCIVSGLDDGTVQVWDASSAEELRSLKGHIDRVNSVSFSMDGTRIISGSDDRTVRVWDASSGQELATLEGHSDCVRSVAFLRDGARIVSGSDDQKVQVWDTSSGEELKTPEGHSDWVRAVAFSPDGTCILSGSDDQTVRVWNASSGEELRTLKDHSGRVNTLAFSPDGMHIVSGFSDHTVRVWNTWSGEMLKTFEGHSDSVTSAAFSPDGTCIVSGSNDKTVRVWDASSWEELKTLEGHSDSVRSVAFSPDGRRIASGSDDRKVRVWDASSGEELNILEGHSGYITSVAFSRDGTRIVSGSEDTTVRVWDALIGEQLKVLEDHNGFITSVAFSRDGACICSGSSDQSVRLWDALSGEELKILEGHSDWVRSVAFSQDGKRIVSAGDDKTVRVWCLTTGGPTVRYTRQKTSQDGHTGWLLSPSDPSAFLMFVPLSEHLPDDFNILTMPHHAVSHVDLSKAKLGTDWAQCYTLAIGK